jgi:hypothetical protein
MISEFGYSKDYGKDGSGWDEKDGKKKKKKKSMLLVIKGTESADNER